MNRSPRESFPREFLLLIGGLVVVLGTMAFIVIADEVSEGSTQRFDERAILALRRAENPAEPIGPGWLSEVGRDLTAVGGVAVLSLVTLAVTGILVIRGGYGLAICLVIATLGGLTVSTILKHTFSRARPEIVPHLSAVYTSSFPSGHAMLSAVVYLTLGALLSRFADNRRSKLYFMGVALILTFLVGVSRVFMGVHYPTDVLAGWAAGLVWAALWWLAVSYLQRRGMVE